MSFEEDIARLNEFYFFREFTFSENTFRKSPTEEVELADNIVWLDEPLIVYQLKERQPQSDTTSEKEQRWFKRKIVDSAKRQIRDTLNYLQNHSNIQIKNHRGHTFNITIESLDSIHKLVLYKAHELLPESCRKLKHHKSQTAGFIHFISSDDYLGIVKTLLTPAEVADYLAFREALVSRWQEDTLHLPEQALVGQYVSGSPEHRPDLHFIKYLNILEHQLQEWDMSGIISVFSDCITTGNHLTDYYYIVREIAKLNRNELREFKRRFELSMDKAKINEFTLPYRISLPRTTCGFVFIPFPLTHDFLESHQQCLQNLTYAHKYPSSVRLRELKWR
ncbi:hypothetical protein NON20_25805 (plasmid) [Synechocystis sp. B12]|nr:hypothetical protein NON20_25805 [Synechocystis sp. B12]